MSNCFVAADLQALANALEARARETLDRARRQGGLTSRGQEGEAYGLFQAVSLLRNAKWAADVAALGAAAPYAIPRGRR